MSSGGLLVAVDPGESDHLIGALKKRGALASHRIGRIIEDSLAKIRVLPKKENLK